MKRLTTLAVLVLLLLAGCTQNERAKNFGGSIKVDLPAGQRLVNATWKDDDLWYLVTPAAADGTPAPRTLTFKEDSSFGVMNGQVVFQEH